MKYNQYREEIKNTYEIIKEIFKYKKIQFIKLINNEKTLFAFGGRYNAIAVTACGGQKSSTESVELTGAGATFPLPFYNMSFEGYGATHDNKVSYGGIGSGGGVRT